MSSLEDAMVEEEIRDGWWEQGEAVMREMTEEIDDSEEKENKKEC